MPNSVPELLHFKITPEVRGAHTIISTSLSYKPSYRKGSSDSMQGYSGFKKDRILAGKAPQ